MKQSERSRRLARLIQEFLPQSLQALCTPNQIGLCTITAVEVASDLKVADVFLRSIGKPHAEVITLLAGRQRALVGDLGRRVTLPRTLQLRFKLDQAPDHARRVHDSLAAIPEGDFAPAPDAGQTPDGTAPASPPPAA